MRLKRTDRRALDGDESVSNDIANLRETRRLRKITQSILLMAALGKVQALEPELIKLVYELHEGIAETSRTTVFSVEKVVIRSLGNEPVGSEKVCWTKLHWA